MPRYEMRLFEVLNDYLLLVGGICGEENDFSEATMWKWPETDSANDLVALLDDC